MTIWIRVAREAGASRLTVDGRLTGDDSTELLRVCEDVPGPKIIELGGVRSVDAHAVSVLRDLQARGVALVGASPYVRLLLGQPATDEDASRS